MDFITIPLIALAASWVFRHKIVAAFQENREPMLWYGLIAVLTIVASTQHGALAAVLTIGVGAYVYIKLSATVHKTEWKGFLNYTSNSVLPRHEERKLLK